MRVTKRNNSAEQRLNGVITSDGNNMCINSRIGHDRRWGTEKMLDQSSSVVGFTVENTVSSFGGAEGAYIQPICLDAENQGGKNEYTTVRQDSEQACEQALDDGGARGTYGRRKYGDIENRGDRDEYTIASPASKQVSEQVLNSNSAGGIYSRYMGIDENTFVGQDSDKKLNDEGLEHIIPDLSIGSDVYKSVGVGRERDVGSERGAGSERGVGSELGVGSEYCGVGSESGVGRKRGVGRERGAGKKCGVCNERGVGNKCCGVGNERDLGMTVVDNDKRSHGVGSECPASMSMSSIPPARLGNECCWVGDERGVGSERPASMSLSSIPQARLGSSQPVRLGSIRSAMLRMGSRQVTSEMSDGSGSKGNALDVDSCRDVNLRATSINLIDRMWMGCRCQNNNMDRGAQNNELHVNCSSDVCICCVSGLSASSINIEQNCTNKRRYKRHERKNSSANDGLECRNWNCEGTPISPVNSLTP